VRPDGVVGLEVRVDEFGEFLAIGDLVAVEMLALQRLVESLDDAVGLRCVVAGADVGELGALSDEGGEVGALVAGAVVGDHDDRG
jgi:hypothetical protein